MRRATVLVVLLALGLAPFAPVGLRAARAAGEQCFPQTGYCADNAFLTFWQTHGATEILGLPVSQPFRDDRGLIVQYYERAIMEWHPENPPAYQVELTLLGAAALGDRPERGAPPVACAGPCASFPETNHTLRGAFLDYWRAHGGLAVFGFPLTEEFQEVSPTNGQTYTVQYFERNRFEYHPENQPPYNVLLGLLGDEALAGQPALLARPAVTVPDYPTPPAGIPARLAIPAINVDAAVEQVGVDANGNMGTPQNPWDTAWYAPGTRPGQPGNAVIAGHVDYHNIGPVVFWDLGKLAPGAEIWITEDNGARLRFIVQRIERYPADQAPLQAIFGPTGDANLNLVTCTGDFDPTTRTYDQRIVVYTRWDGIVR
ncbi:MAG TPA: class F sortase [Thermomicrobiales bacterium]|nr:class F sortase [Thermomicrobiales bacterium]